jgi:hypothetical protein
MLVSPVSATPRLTLSAVRGFAGSTVEIPLTFRYASNDLRNVVGLQADVRFDSALATGSTPGRGELLTNQVFDAQPLGAGWNRLVAYSENYQPLTTNGTLAQFTLTARPGVLQNVRMILSNVFLTTAEGSLVPVTPISGGIVINVVFLKSSGGADGYLLINTNTAGGRCFVVEATQDFTSWTAIDTNTASGGFLLFTDQETDAETFPYRFYRAIECDP